MVDRTTIQIFEKLHYFEEFFYDRKTQYFINTQIINTLNWQIMDYVTKFNGSCHDTYCVVFTQISKYHKNLLPNKKYC